MPESKPEPERHNGVKLSFYVSPDLRQKIIDYQHAQKMRTLSEAEIDLLEKGLLADSEFSNLPCEFKSLILGHPDLINCKKGTRTRRFTITMKAQECADCQKTRLEQWENWPLEKKYNDLLQVCGLKNQTIQDLREQLASAMQNIEALKTKPTFAENRAMVSQPVIHSESVPTPTYENPLPQNSQQVKRVIEENRTRRTTEFVTPPQQKLPSLTQQKAPPLPEIILCPDIGETVNVEETCKKICQKRDACNYYEQIIVKKAIAKQ